MRGSRLLSASRTVASAAPHEEAMRTSDSHRGGTEGILLPAHASASAFGPSVRDGTEAGTDLGQSRRQLCMQGGTAVSAASRWRSTRREHCGLALWARGNASRRPRCGQPPSAARGGRAREVCQPGVALPLLLRLTPGSVSSTTHPESLGVRPTGAATKAACLLTLGPVGKNRGGSGQRARQGNARRLLAAGGSRRFHQPLHGQNQDTFRCPLAADVWLA
mmetsp:Transcript_23364/g.88662  ORF Transcript_23364/g.88662 Transcript_23364/m.88662 type:complete len:220 (-) Transcript_23364:1210-1869(-)